MKNYNFEYEQKKYPYQFYGKVKEETNEHGKFLLKSALEYIIDDYDPYIDSIEKPHYEDLGYYEVRNYDIPEDIENLDLTWMNKNDVFIIDPNKQNILIKKIIVNIDNLICSQLPYICKEREQFNNVNLEIHNNNSELSPIKQIKYFKSFIEHNKSYISDNVTLEGFSPVMNMILNQYLKRYGLGNSKEKQYVKK